MQTLKNIGFGYVEVGSVTPLQQSGQEKPRLFRLTENEAIINRLVFLIHLCFEPKYFMVNFNVCYLFLSSYVRKNIANLCMF